MRPDTDAYLTVPVEHDGYNVSSVHAKSASSTSGLQSGSMKAGQQRR